MPSLREQASSVIAARRSELRSARAASAAVTLTSLASTGLALLGFGDSHAEASAARAGEMVAEHFERWAAEGLRRADAGEPSQAWWTQWEATGRHLVADFADVVGWRYEATPLGVIVGATAATAGDVADAARDVRDAAWSAAAWWGRWGLWVVALAGAAVALWVFRVPVLAALSSASKALAPAAARGARNLAKAAA